tara:strand:- start:227 stop:583 length:357 start_codon:yes stop_codon:yes gene_type:complete
MSGDENYSDGLRRYCESDSFKEIAKDYFFKVFKEELCARTQILLDENTGKLVSGLVGALSLYPSENLTDPLAAKINEIKSEQLEKEGEVEGEVDGEVSKTGGSKKKNYRKTRKIRKKK